MVAVEGQYFHSMNTGTVTIYNAQYQVRLTLSIALSSWCIDSAARIDIPASVYHISVYPHFLKLAGRIVEET